jgi:hypothetical protein
MSCERMWGEVKIVSLERMRGAANIINLESGESLE